MGLGMMWDSDTDQILIKRPECDEGCCFGWYYTRSQYD